MKTEIVSSLSKLSSIIHDIGPKKKVLAIVGGWLGHSLSHILYEQALERSRLDIAFLRLEIKPRQFEKFMTDFVVPESRKVLWNLRGLAVTCPYKEKVLPYLSKMDHQSKHVQAVNTVVVKAEGLYGLNTDVEAGVTAIKSLMRFDRDTTCAVIGTGGVARALVAGLVDEGVLVSIVARDIEKAYALKKRFEAHSVRRLEKFRGGFDIVINATNVGMEHSPQEGKSVVPARVFQGERVQAAFDVVCSREITPFLRDAKKAQCHIQNGLKMFHLQFEEQFKALTGVNVPDGVGID